jgi:pimeloyl-ACP methyl ester carboxylesterase
LTFVDGESITSADGTTIGYRRFGAAGPAVVLLHGGGQAGRNLERLATALAADFTVYVPDRRGRGASGPAGDGYGAATERADLSALLAHAGARLVFGLSSGGIIALDAARHLPGICAVAVYEPPLSIDGSTPQGWVPRFRAELAAGKRGAAAVTALRGTRTGGPLLFLVSRRSLSRLYDGRVGPVMRVLLWPLRRANRQRPADHDPRALILTMGLDAQLVAESEGTLDAYRTVAVPVLLLGGTRSPGYLQRTLRRLADVLPAATLKILPGAGHTAPDDSGRPVEVAAELTAFFARQQ